MFLRVEAHRANGLKKIHSLSEHVLHGHQRRVVTKTKTSRSGSLQQCLSYFKRRMRVSVT